MRAYVRRTKASASATASEQSNQNGISKSYELNSDTTTITTPSGDVGVNQSAPNRNRNVNNAKTWFDAEENLWHLRLGHTMSLPYLRKSLKEGNLPYAECRLTDCKHCGKIKFRRRFTGSLTSATSIGRIHCDTKEMVNCIFDDGHKYFITIIEEFTRFVYACPVQSKAEASEILLRFVKRFEKQSVLTFKAVHTDNGTEFSRAITALTDNGLVVTTSTVDTPESRGLAERTHQTIVGDVRTCLDNVNLLERYWHYALRHAVNSGSAVPSSTTGKSLSSSDFEERPTYLKLIGPFGCHVICKPKADQLTTFSPRGSRGLNLLHDDGGVYRILANTGVVRTKHVNYMETKFQELTVLGNEGRNATSPPDTNGGTIAVPIPVREKSSDEGHIPKADITHKVSQPADTDSITSSQVREMLTHYPTGESSFGQLQSEKVEKRRRGSGDVNFIPDTVKNNFNTGYGGQ